MPLGAIYRRSEILLTAINAQDARRVSQECDRYGRLRLSVSGRGHGEFAMLDVLMVVSTLAFFALSVAYGYACDRL